MADNEYGQSVPDPVAHFEAIPWCYQMMNDSSTMGVTALDREKLPDNEGSLMRETLNNQNCIKASVFFFRDLDPKLKEKNNGEDPENPFVEGVSLLDLGGGVNGLAGTVHGGFFGVLLDEVMGSVANLQGRNGAYTAYLKVTFKKPVYAPQVVCMRGRVQKKDGRKLFVKGSMENSEGQVLAEGEGLWIVVGKQVKDSVHNREAKL